MAEYGIMRVEKRRRSAVYGLQLEANRTVADHTAGRDFEQSDIRWTETHRNIFLVRTENWNNAIRKELKQHGIKERSDSVVLLDGLYTASKAFFDTHPKAEHLEYFKACLAFHEAHYGKVINAVIHYDEETPHLQVASIPLAKVNRGGQDKTVLSAKTLMGNRDDYHRRQNEFYEQVSRSWGLSRGEPHKASKKHITKREWQNNQLQAVHDSLVAKDYPMVLNCYLNQFLNEMTLRQSRNGQSQVITIKDLFEQWVEQQFQQQLRKYPGTEEIVEHCRNYIHNNDYPGFNYDDEELER